MSTYYIDSGGIAINDVANWGWRDRNHAGRLMVCIHAVIGWTEDRLFDAVTDDFGNLVQVR